MNNWMEITFWLPVVVIPIFLLALLVFAFLLYRSLRRRRQRNAEIEAAYQQAQNKIAALEQFEQQWQSTTEAYRDFVYIVSHEAANPLQSIQTNLDNLVASDSQNQQQWQPYYQGIVAEIRRLSRLTENLRFLSHLETQQAPIARQMVNLKAIIEDVIILRSPEAEEKGLNLVYMGPAEAIRVMGNQDQLRQVLLNLIDNSIKYSQEDGGLITIAMDYGEGLICIRVSDEGVGIDAEDLPYVFAAAYRSPNAWSYRRRGSGLGLNIAQRIVEQHGGQMQIESQLGVGTVVSFELPAIPTKELSGAETEL